VEFCFFAFSALRTPGKRKEKKKMESSVAIQVLPKVQDTKEVCRIVDEVIAYIRDNCFHGEIPQRTAEGFGEADFENL